MCTCSITVNNVPRILYSNPSNDDYCIIFSEFNFYILLHLDHTYSYFNSRLPIIEELYFTNKLFITPDTSNSNPYYISFVQNENFLSNYDSLVSKSIRDIELPIEIKDE